MFNSSLGRLLSLSALAAVLLGCGGCAFMSDEDRDFYGKGWVKPTELDADPKPHHIQDPSHPETMTTADNSVPTTTPTQKATDQGAEWIVPQTSNH